MIEDNFTPVKMKLSVLTGHVDGFIASCSSKSKETQAGYKRTLKEFVYFFSTDRLFQFRVRDVERYKKYLLKTKKMQEISVASYLTSLRRFCQFLVTTGVLEKNPAKRVQGGRRPTEHTRTFLTFAEIDQLVNSIDDTTNSGLRDKALILTMLGCACSETELTHAQVGDLKRMDKHWTLRVQSRDNSTADERIFVPKMTLDAIEAYLRSRGTNIQPETPLFLSYSNRSLNQPMSIRGIREAINLRLKSSNVKQGKNVKLTPFSLRHTAGILLAERGATLEEIMKRMRIEWQPTAMIYFKQKGMLHMKFSQDADILSTGENKG